ncbi:uncharacterized protein METZ01_LOCUS114039, partial [marine metagenome]
PPPSAISSVSTIANRIQKPANLSPGSSKN